VGDDPERVRINRKMIFTALAQPLESSYDAWQVHGSEVVVVQQPRLPAQDYQQADAILTDRPGVTLFMRFADCVPILLYDPVKRAIGLVHAGWQGTLKGVARQAVERMQAEFRSIPGSILAAIGPSIAAHHYPVGANVITETERVFGGDAQRFLHHTNGSFHFDLWEANKRMLESCGLRDIETAGICTACHLDDWFSHRAEHGKTGRFGVLITLGEESR
jgi:hypothetical protein